MKINNIVTLLTIFLVAVFVGCAPRGESKSLDEVYKIALSRFQAVRNEKVPAHLQESLNKLADNLVAAADGRINTKIIIDELELLADHAAFTNRPAFAELTTQYYNVSANESKQIATNPAAIKLLASRTMSLLASELETTKFKL